MINIVSDDRLDYFCVVGNLKLEATYDEESSDLVCELNPVNHNQLSYQNICGKPILADEYGNQFTSESQSSEGKICIINDLPLRTDPILPSDMLPINNFNTPETLTFPLTAKAHLTLQNASHLI
jgi:hypothetical protein